MTTPTYIVLTGFNYSPRKGADEKRHNAGDKGVVLPPAIAKQLATEGVIEREVKS